MAVNKVRRAKAKDAASAAPAAPVSGYVLPGGDAFVGGQAGSAPVKIETRGSNPFKKIGGSDVPAFNSILLREVIDVLHMPAAEKDATGNASARIAAAAAALAAFNPADEVEGMLAAQAVALHYTSMECLRRSVLPEQHSDVAGKLRKDGANLARAMSDMLEALERKRGRGPQVIRVEKLVVQDGGQAAVGVFQPATKQAVVAAPESAPATAVATVEAPCEVRGGEGECRKRVRTPCAHRLRGCGPPRAATRGRGAGRHAKVQP